MRTMLPTLLHPRLMVLVAFTAVCTALFGYLWVNSGGRIPLITATGYRVSVDFPEVSNLVYDSEVRLAGVPVGQIAGLEAVDGVARVELELRSNFPLHEGLRIEARNKTLIQETYLDIVDGSGPEIPDGARLPADVAVPAVELDDVLRSLDAPTRDSLGGLLRSADEATSGSSRDISAAVRGLGDVGREGGVALNALADQSEDLEQLSRQTATVLAALDAREGQIAQLVTDSELLFSATAENGEHIATTMRTLPGLLDVTHDASDDLTSLSTNLGPVAADLREAAPDLSDALRQLPETSADLRGMLPSLQQVLDEAPATLDRTPQFAEGTSGFIGATDVALSDVNPMLSYMEPYGRDVSAFFSNFAQALNRGDANGKTLRIFMVFNEASYRGQPVSTNQIPLLDRSNAYPAPGSADRPGPFDGQYTRVQQDPPR
ncbi:MlaD family protein [Pseudonocardia abyssalis]|uniref:MCE family protein n=1 Tax=Pseudonocardia abyssalis TaxID=2792008 RepID=A0ABS6URD8_9PSEU|nr:MlaD family protein [Pseudonocardia abyssalis]MBW0113741.1 MCE family protein [Pseudonocardia abyssalis]MBW0134814.1 MCE family protein [Pseudonocardia abyssalis]